MLYLKCNQCGFNNPVRSESILFCESCNKKLQNNFRDWHKLHPDKTFDDFSRLFCINEFDLAAQNTPAKGKNQTLKIVAIVLGSLLVFVIMLGTAAYFFGKKFLDNTLKTSTEQTVLSKEWHKTKVGNSELLLELPFKLEKQELPFPEEAKALMDTVEAYSHISDNGFKVITTVITYKDGLEANVENAVAGSVTETEKMQGIADFKWHNQDTIVGKLRGIITVMNYKLLTYPIELKALTVCNKNKLYQVITQYSEDDANGKQAAGKIISSVEIRAD